VDRRVELKPHRRQSVIDGRYQGLFGPARLAKSSARFAFSTRFKSR
jgi:hypothetical protein